MMMRRRPLLRGAMVGGAAYYAGRKVTQGDQREAEQQARIDALEQQQYMAAQAAPAQAPPVAPAPGQQPASQQSMVEKLTDLKRLLDQGVLTQSEFDVQKSRILNG